MLVYVLNSSIGYLKIHLKKSKDWVGYMHIKSYIKV